MIPLDPPSDRSYTEKELVHLRREMDKHREQELLALKERLLGLETNFHKEFLSLEGKIKSDYMEYENELIQKAVDTTVERVFSILEVDIHNPADIRRFRDNLRFGDMFRNAATRGFLALLAAIFGAIGMSIWPLISALFSSVKDKLIP